MTPQQQREVDRFLELEREAARRAEAEARANAQIAAERKERDRAARAARDRAARAARDAELEARWAGFARDADGVAGSCCDGGDFGSAAEHACCGSSGLCCACAIGKDPNCCCCGAYSIFGAPLRTTTAPMPVIMARSISIAFKSAAGGPAMNRIIKYSVF